MQIQHHICYGWNLMEAVFLGLAQFFHIAHLYYKDRKFELKQIQIWNISLPVFIPVLDLLQLLAAHNELMKNITGSVPNSRVFLCSWAFRFLEMENNVLSTLWNLSSFSLISLSEASGFLGLEEWLEKSEETERSAEELKMICLIVRCFTSDSQTDPWEKTNRNTSHIKTAGKSLQLLCF